MGQKCKVMVIDDQVWVRTMLLEALSSSGYKTCEASNGMEALELAHHERPDIALVDVNIPGIDGLTLLAHLKKLKPDIAIIFMSGSSNAEYIKSANKDGAVCFLVKPFDIFELTAILDKLSAALDLAARGEGKWEMCSGTVRLIS